MSPNRERPIHSGFGQVRVLCARSWADKRSTCAAASGTRLVFYQNKRKSSDQDLVARHCVSMKATSDTTACFSVEARVCTQLTLSFFDFKKKKEPQTDFHQRTTTPALSHPPMMIPHDVHVSKDLAVSATPTAVAPTCHPMEPWIWLSCCFVWANYRNTTALAAHGVTIRSARLRVYLHRRHWRTKMERSKLSSKMWR